jgi:hypothetical protein
MLHQEIGVPIPILIRFLFILHGVALEFIMQIVLYSEKFPDGREWEFNSSSDSGTIKLRAENRVAVVFALTPEPKFLVLWETPRFSNITHAVDEFSESVNAILFGCHPPTP